MKARGRFLDHFGLRLAASGRSAPPRGRFGRHPGVCNLDFYAFFLEKRGLYNSMPLCSGSATFASPGAQVAATWAQKSESNGPKLKSQGPGQSSLAGRFGLAGGVMQRLGNGAASARP